MAKMTEAEWQHLYENFETTWLLDAVHELDKVRAMLAEGEDCDPPDIRTALLNLHGLAMSVVNKGAVHQAEAFFETAQGIELYLADMIEALEFIQRTLNRLESLYPDSLAGC